METDELLYNEEMNNYETTHHNSKKEKLYQLITTGKSKMYLGKVTTIEQVQTLSPEEVDALYDRYQSTLGAKMSKSIGKSLISLYTKTFSYFFKVKDVDVLYDELINDPVVSNTIGVISCELYYRFGNLLGPVAVALISANNIDLKPDYRKILEEDEVNDFSLEKNGERIPSRREGERESGREDREERRDKNPNRENS